MIGKIKHKINQRHHIFCNSNKSVDVELSDKTKVENNLIQIYVNSNETDITKNNITKTFKLCELPIPLGNGFININGTNYKLVTGLIQKDGFYMGNAKGNPYIDFIFGDKIIFKIKYKNNNLVVKLNKTGKEISITEFLLGLKVIGNEAEVYDVLESSFGIRISEKIKTQKELSKEIYTGIFGREVKTNYTDILIDKFFNKFIGASEEYENKNLFFSYSKYLGCEIVKYDGLEKIEGIIDRDKALKLDRLKAEEVVLKTKNGKVVTVTRDFNKKFTKEDLVRVIKQLILKKEDNASIKEDNQFSIFNKQLYTTVDYYSDYVYCLIKKYSSSVLEGRLISGKEYKSKDIKDFTRWFKDTYDEKGSKEKGSGVLTANNLIEYENSKNRFTKDLLRGSIDSIDNRERLYDLSYIGWISPSVTSDTQKVGLSGIFMNDVLKDDKLCRKFYYIDDNYSNDEDFNIDNLESKKIEEELEPWETFNLKILYLEPDGRYSVVLNGEYLKNAKINEADRICYTEDIADFLTGNSVACWSNQPKRHKLGSKAIHQSLPLIGINQRQKTGAMFKYSDRVVGVTFEELESNIKLSTTLLEPDEKLESLKLYNYTINDETIELILLVKNNSFNFSFPRYILSPSENTRLEFKVNTSKKEFQRGDTIIVAGRYKDIGQEVTVAYGCLDGFTYEDGIIFTTNFVKRMGLSTKLYFTQKTDLKGEMLDESIKDSRHDSYTMNNNGLPRKGTYVTKNSIIGVVTVKNNGETTQRCIFAENTGYVEAVNYNDTNNKVKITISSIRTLTNGDKIGNTHGNKGVCVRIVNSEDLIVNGGKDIDLILSPLGTVGRMNVGQQKEMLINTLCQVKNIRSYEYTKACENKTIKELYEELDSIGGYKEHTVYYKNVKLRQKWFVGTMNEYRMKQYSDIHTKSTGMPELDINQVVSEGQRLSMSCSVLFSAYDSNEILNYLIKYQSRNDYLSRELIRKLKNGEDVTDKDCKKATDTVIWRIKAILNTIGFDLENNSIRFLQRGDLKSCSIKTKDSSGVDNIRDIRKYNLSEYISVGFDIIMPKVLEALWKYIPIQALNENIGNTTKLEIGDLRILKNLTQIDPRRRTNQRLCAKLSEDSSYLLVDYYSSERLQEGFLTGYKNLMGILKDLDCVKSLGFISNPKKYKEFKTSLEKYDTKNIFREVMLPGIPYPPDNIIPKFEGKNAQSIESYYRNIGKSDNVDYIMKELLTVHTFMCKKLFSHGSYKSPDNGKLSMSKKSSEVFDNLIARRYGYSFRGVMGFDPELEIDEVEIPRKIICNVFKELIINNYMIENGISMTSNNKKEIQTLLELYKEKEVDKSVKESFDAILEEVTFERASLIIREPILRRQNMYSFLIKIGEGDSIKINPMNCPSYNMDFDGDAGSGHAIKSRRYSKQAMLKMSVYSGMLDYSSNKLWIKPIQDALLGLYLCSKETTDNEIKKIYGYNINLMSDVKQDFELGMVELNDLVTVYSKEFDRTKLTTTVGKLLILLNIREDALMQTPNHLRDVLDILNKPITKDNIDELFMYLIDNKESLFNIIYSLKDEFTPTEQRIMRSVVTQMGHSFKELNKLGYYAITYTGVTLQPRELASIRSYEDDDNQKTVDVKYTDEFSKNENEANYLRSEYDIRIAKNNTNYVNTKSIENDIMNTTNIADILLSGSRGKINDFVKVYSPIGINNYLNTERNITSNYSKGVTIVEQSLLSQTVRVADIAVNTNLGIKGAELPRKAIEASRVNIVEDNCGAKPVIARMKYDIKIDGLSLDSIRNLEVKKEDEQELFSKIGIKSDVKKIPTHLISKYLNTNLKGTFSNKKVEYQLSKESKLLIKDKYILINDVEMMGSDAIELIQETKPKEIGVYMLYNCLSNNGICRHCFGRESKVNNVRDFNGNLGVNIIYDIGEDAVQNTLDASKSSQGATETKLNLFSIYNNSTLANQPMILGNDKIGNFEFSYDLNEITYNKEKSTTIITLSSKFLSQSFFEDSDHLNFDTYTNFLDVKEDNETQVNINKMYEETYVNYLYSFIDTLNVQKLDTLFCINTRFVKNDEKDILPYNKENKDMERYWLTESELQTTMDLVSSFCMKDVTNNFISRAVTRRENGVSPVFENLYNFDKSNDLKEKTSVKHISQNAYVDVKSIMESNKSIDKLLVELEKPKEVDIQTEVKQPEVEYTDEEIIDVNYFEDNTTSEFGG